MWSRLHHLLVNTAHRHHHESTVTCHEGQSFKRGCCCTLYRCGRCSGCVLRLRGCFCISEEVWFHIVLPNAQAASSSLARQGPLLRLCVRSYIFPRSTGNMAHPEVPFDAVTKGKRAWCSTAVVAWLPQIRELESLGDGVIRV